MQKKHKIVLEYVKNAPTTVVLQTTLFYISLGQFHELRAGGGRRTRLWFANLLPARTTARGVLHSVHSQLLGEHYLAANVRALFTRHTFFNNKPYLLRLYDTTAENIFLTQRLSQI